MKSQSSDMPVQQEIDRKIGLLMREIRKEEVPERLLQLARRLQTAIDMRGGSSK